LGFWQAYVIRTDSSSHAKPSKKQKTSKSGGVWAAGTGYGGASDHPHHYLYWGGKHGKKKPPENPPESAAENKAKLAERDADNRLEKAMDGLISCLSGGGGDGLVSGLSLPLVALVHESGTPARVLRALLLNDSMIDVSNRGALYLKALQVKPLSCWFKGYAERRHLDRATSSFIERWSFIGRFIVKELLCMSVLH
jgi:hypothetical protein